MNSHGCNSTDLPGQGRDASAYAATGEEEHRYLVPDDARPCRLDAFLGEMLRHDGISREKIKQAVISGRVSRNGEPCLKPNTRVVPGDEIFARLPRAPEALEAEQGEVAVLRHDEHLAVLNKPAGLTVHPAPGLESGTLAHRLLRRFPELADQGGLRPGIVHRLDKDTSGLMLVALTEKTRLILSEAFAARLVKKEYLALVHGVPRASAGTILEPIGRHPTQKTKMAVVPLSRGGKEAHSEYTVLYADPARRFSLLRVAIHTGRTHQIRVHMRHIGHPLVGDAVYAAPHGHNNPDIASRQMLHAWKLSFTHPVTGAPLSFCVEPPDDFRRAAALLAESMQRVVVTGSPGSGKSTLTKILRAAELPVWSADETVQRLYAKDGDGRYVLQRRFGQRFVPNDDAGVDKKALFAAMTASEDIRLEVEHLIHPLVRHDLAAFWAQCEAEGSPAAVAEIPLYLEAGWRNGEAVTGRRGESGSAKPGAALAASRDILAGVYCPFAIRRKRMRENRGWDDALIAAMESWQWPEDKKIRAADLVVDNSGDIEDMRQRAQGILKILASLRDHARQRASRSFTSLWRCGPGASNGAT